MSYKIIRLDGKEDKITSYYFENYSDRNDLLEKIYGNLFCSESN